MTIKALDLAIGTVISVTGGTATGMISKGNIIGRHDVALDDGSAYKDETTLKFTSKEPAVSAQAPAGYTQARNDVVITRPKTLANLATTKNTLRISLSVDPETTDAEIDSLLELGAQIFFDTALDAYWKDRSSE